MELLYPEETPGEDEGLEDGPGDDVAVGEAVPRGETLSCGDAEGEVEAEGEGEGDGEGDGLASRSSQVQSSPAYPPISLSKAAQRSCSFCKSGGPGVSSAEPGKTRYVIFRSLAGRL
jgi:hypothetical protein